MKEQTKPGRLLKQHMVEQIAKRFKKATNLFITDCGSLTNKQIEELRGKLKRVSSNFLVVKNSMCLLALKKLKLDAAVALIKGTCGITYDSVDSVTTSKVLIGFAKENEKFQLKGAWLNGEVVSVDVVKEMASLPSREVLLVRLVSVLNSPISGMALILSGIINKLVYVLNAVEEKKEKGVTKINKL